MIWTRGEIVPDEALRISVLDRTFEHGLGLFETFRTWNGHATLLHRHLERMRRSAGALGIPLDPGDLPDEAAVLRLWEESPLAGSIDLRLRITVSGGRPGTHGDVENSTVWMTAGPLPVMRPHGAWILRSILVDPDDPLVRHKTLNYWRRRIEQARAVEDLEDEVLCVTPDGVICEGTRSNIFLAAYGRLITPGTNGPLLDGIMRRVVIEHARSIGIKVVEGNVAPKAIACAGEAFLTNSVRGIVPVRRLLHANLPAPGPLTENLRDHIVRWLESGGTPR